MIKRSRRLPDHSLGGLIVFGLHEPWKIWFEVLRGVVWPFVWLTLRVGGVKIGRGWRIYGRPVIHRYRGSRITIGERFENRNWFAANAVAIERRTVISTLSRQATITIGSDVGLSGGVIAARSSIEIGDRTLIGSNVLIIDNDFHPRDPATRRYGRTSVPTEPISIGQDVFVGARAIILKGTTIGDRSVVGAGSVVNGSFPADVVIAGAPAKIVGSLQADGTLQSPVEWAKD